MEAILILLFIIGYLSITLEHPLKLDKTVPALLMASLMWALLAVGFHKGWFSVIDGYGAVFNINYRLATGAPNLFPTQEMDVKKAIEFIYSKRSEYGISDKFVLLGASAGGHLSCLYAYKYNTPVKIKAVVDFFGPTDLVDMFNNPANFLVPFQLMSVTGGTPTSVPTIYAEANPLNYITAQSPPTIILHGGVDIVVLPSQSVLLKNKLNSFGVTNQYVFYPSENHGWGGATMTDSFDKIAAFLNANVN